MPAGKIDTPRKEFPLKLYKKSSKQYQPFFEYPWRVLPGKRGINKLRDPMRKEELLKFLNKGWTIHVNTLTIDHNSAPPIDVHMTNNRHPEYR
jgi:hypothetical protein